MPSKTLEERWRTGMSSYMISILFMVSKLVWVLFSNIIYQLIEKGTYTCDQVISFYKERVKKKGLARGRRRKGMLGNLKGTKVLWS